MINSFPFRSHSKLPYESSISLISLAACLWTVNRGRTCNLHTETPHPDGGIELRPFTCEATVLNAAPPCCTVLQVFFGSLILCVHLRSKNVYITVFVLESCTQFCTIPLCHVFGKTAELISLELCPIVHCSYPVWPHRGQKLAWLQESFLSIFWISLDCWTDFCFFFATQRCVFSSCSPELTLRYREDKYPKDQHIIISVLGTPLKSVWI